MILSKLSERESDPVQPSSEMADDGFAAFMSFVGDGDGDGAANHDDKPVDSTPVKQQQQSDEKPNEDEYHYEEEQEREAMMKNYHHPMKQWFRQNPNLTVMCMLLHVAVCAVNTNRFCFLLVVCERRQSTGSTHSSGRISRRGRPIAKC